METFAELPKRSFIDLLDLYPIYDHLPIARSAGRY
jgi:hypothetical protein